jgi:hypothetical protein
MCGGIENRHKYDRLQRAVTKKDSECQEETRKRPHHRRRQEWEKICGACKDQK